MNEIYTFLGYELNTVTHTLTRHRKPVGLRPKSVATLEYLIAHRHRVVTKDEILDAVWPDVCVQEQAVFQSISELRALFGPARSIDTIRGQGYQWILPMAGTTSENRDLRPGREWLAVAAAAAVLIVGMAWLIPERAGPSVDLVIHPLALADIDAPPVPIAASFDETLVEQLRRYGWAAETSGDAGSPIDAMTVGLQLDTSNEQAALAFQLHSATGPESGRIFSETLFGAVRDLAFELHETMTFHSSGHVDSHHLSRMFRRAKSFIDGEQFAVAEAYLTVIVNELPDHAGAMTVLAYTYQQMNRIDDALQWAHAALAVTEDSKQAPHATDHMMVARLLSNLLWEAGHFDDSDRFAREALGIATRLNDLLVVAEMQEQLGELSIARGQVLLGREQLNVALQYYSSFCPAGEARVSNRLIELESEPLAANG
ncbi:MAG: winged helix-turn-helix domain-containing protein [Xanthomonadales bacterium]|nr:winged helix-turn-helix domain-containing protein [Xanthomonadales bacterium]